MGLFAALALTAMLSPLEGIPSPDQTDARCVVAMNVHAEAASEEDKVSLNGVMLFYVGKLMGRHSPEEAGDLIEAAGKEAPNLDLKALGLQCAKEMETVGNVLQGS